MPATILILAGCRPGGSDPLATAHGVDDKCLVPVAGEAMLVHVLRTALAATAGEVIISVSDEAAAAQAIEGLTAPNRARLRFIKASANLADSVVAALDGARFPVLVTTSDACLLSPETIAEVDAAATARGADAAVAVARKVDVLAAHPDGQRRFHCLADVEVSNGNAYWLASPKALRAAAAFRNGDPFVNKPVRALRAFGLLNLIRFRFWMGPLAHMFDRLGHHMRLTLEPVIVIDGAAAIVVDNERTLRATEEVMAARAAPAGFARAA